MKTITHTILFIVFISNVITFSYGQTIEIGTNPTIKPVLVTNPKALYNARNLAEELDVKTSFLQYSKVVSFEGDVIYTKKNIIKQIDNQWTIIKPPMDQMNSYFQYPTLDRNGNILSYIEHDRKNAIVNFFDINQQTLDKPYVFPRSHSLIIMVRFSMNDDGTVFTHSIFNPFGYTVYVVDRKENEFITREIAKDYGAISNLFLSTSGNRLFYRANARIDNRRDMKIFYADRSSNGWSEPEILNVPKILINDRTYAPILHDIANDGQTALVCCGEKGLALIHEHGDGVWNPPEYIDYFPTIGDKVQMSDDGTVIAVQILDNFDEIYNQRYYNLYTWIYSPSTGWLKNQINKEGEYLYEDAILSGNGEKLYWTVWDKNE